MSSIGTKMSTIGTEMSPFGMINEHDRSGNELNRDKNDNMSMNNLKYSIIYGALRPSIHDQISVGIVLVDGDKLDIRYSRKKLLALRGLLPEKMYRFLYRVIVSLNREKTLDTVDKLNYLVRYSNNLVIYSPLQEVDLAATEKNKELLYKRFVFNGEK